MTSSGRTAWTRMAATPIRAFLQTESGSAGVLLAAIVAALVWANADVGSYDTLWHTDFSVRLGDIVVARDVRTWLNDGLMTLFFLVVGLEARREIDLGDLRDRVRFLLPAAAGLVGMALPVGIYLVINAHDGNAHGWGVAMSTDTALALGLLVLVGREVPDRVRAFLLTVFVVDDIAALVVIATVYTERVEVVPLVLALLAFGMLLVMRAAGVRSTAVYAVLGVLVWAATLASGVDPVVSGLAIGLSAPAYSPGRSELEQVSGLVRLFREQPTVALARSATQQLTSTMSPNARWQRFYHPWTSFVIVPLFGLANAGIPIDAAFLSHALSSPITLGILIGYVVGKPIAVIATSWLVARATRGRVRPAVGWAAITASGTIAGIGFTVSFLVATLAFTGRDLAEAKLGLLTAGAAAALLTWAVFRITALLPTQRRTAAVFGNPDDIVDLVDDVDPQQDHIRGSAQAVVTVVEYGDFQCPYCGLAEAAVQQVVADTDVRYVWRHLPLTDVHSQAQLAAEFSEAAAAQGAFWPVHDLLLTKQDRLSRADLMSYAEQLGLDGEQIGEALARSTWAARVAHDVESADLSNVSGTPTFFINGLRFYDTFDPDTLSAAIRVARDRASLTHRG